MRNTRTMKRAGWLAGVMALAMVAAGCGSDAGSNGEAGGGEAGGGEAGGTVNLGILPAWTDGLATAYLWKNVLEEEGYEVEITELSEAAPLYAGLAGGDVDVYPSAWSEATHADYMDEYGDDIEDLATYYGGAKLTMAVPEYVDIDSIEDLQGEGNRFDGRIVGIESGAGLTRVTKESVMPAYDLEGDYELVESSTTAMLAELESAVEAEEDIVVTLWRPFWANASFPVKDLEDPKGALGDPEGLHVLARSGFADDFPDVADMFANFELDDEQFGTLEDLMVNEYDGEPDKAAEAWLEENPDFVDSLNG